MSNEDQPESRQSTTDAESFREALDNFRRGLLKTAEEWREPLRKASQQYIDIVESFKPTAALLTEQINLFRDQIGPFLMRVKEVAEKAPPAYKGGLLTLGEHGWYMDMEMPLTAPIEISNAFKEGNVTEAEEAIASYFEARLDEIEQFLAKSLPARAKVIGSAFQAHRSGQFDLSVPVLLAQTDGICREISGQHLFMSHRDKSYKGRPETAAYVETMASDVMWSAILSPLGEKLPINKSAKDRGPDFAGLNRHMVLHGESLDYGTRINSLKAISLINYVTQVLVADKGDP